MFGVLAVAHGCWTTSVHTTRATGNIAAIFATGSTASAAETPYRRGQACRTKEGGLSFCAPGLESGQPDKIECEWDSVFQLEMSKWNC